MIWTRSTLVRLAILLALAAGVFAMRLLVYRDLDSGVSFAWPEGNVLGLRRTAAVAALVVGASLAISGVMLQALLRNPLASPFILGLSAGAGLGVMVALYIGYRTDGDVLAFGSHTTPALAGALLTLAVVYLLGQKRGWLDPVSLVLVGVVVSSICGALIMFFQYLVPEGLRADLIRWLMGRIPEHVPASTLWLTSIIAGAGLIVGALCGRMMDVATLGDEEARTVGLATGPVRLFMFTFAGILTAAAVALAGPIGFVGLIAPHAARMVLGPSHGPLIIGSALIGAVLVVGADVARQGIDLGAGRMPVGIFTALIGGPMFIWLLRSGKAQA